MTQRPEKEDTATYLKDFVYTGEVDEVGLPHGEGIYIYNNGDVYTGSFMQNERHGYGKMVWATGDSYEGSFRFNVPSGHGTYTFSNGDKYVGCFCKALFSGQGQLVYHNGCSWTGGFRRGLKHGSGVFRYENGDTWTGEFRRELPHGSGTLVVVATGYTETGVFLHGEPTAKLSAEDESKFDQDEEEEKESDESSDEEKEEDQSVVTAQSKDCAPPGGKSVFHNRHTKNADFKELSYWDCRFGEEEQYDWLLTYTQVRAYLLPLLASVHMPAEEDSSAHAHEDAHSLRLRERQSRIARAKAAKGPNKTISILVVGCGNSTFSADLYDEGYENITNIDYSPVVIDKMRGKNSRRPNMRWVVMDMTRLAFEEGTTFDIIIDKAAMDAIMVDEGDVWDPKDSVREASDRMMHGMRALLAPKGGLFLMISFMQPHFRSKYLMGLRAGGEMSEAEAACDPYSPQLGFCKRYDWTLAIQTIEVESGCLSSFLYVMVVKPGG